MPYTYGGSSGSGGGGYSYTPAAAATGGSGLDALLSQLRQGEAPEEGKGLFGLLENLVGGVAGVVGGLGKWVLNDAIAAVQDTAGLLPGVESDANYMTDDIAKAMVGYNQPGHPGLHPGQSVLAKDFAKRYGPLLPGGEPASQVLGEMYEDPVSYILDVASVVSGGATAAAALGGKTLGPGARAAALVGSKVDDLAEAGSIARAARISAEVADELKKAGASTRAYTRAGYRAGLESLAPGTAPLAQALAPLLPKRTYRVVEQGTRAGEASQMFMPVASSVNPLYRPIGAAVRAGTMRPIAQLSEQARKLADDIADTRAANQSLLPDGTYVGKAEETLRLYNEMLEGAKELGAKPGVSPITKIEKPWAMKARQKLTAHDIEKRLGMEGLRLREQEIQDYREVLQRYLDEDEMSMVDFHVTETGLNIGFDRLLSEPWYQARYPNGDDTIVHLADDVEDVQRTISPGDWARAEQLGDGWAERTQAAIQSLEELKQKYINDPDPEGLVRRTGSPIEREVGNIDRIIRGLEDGLVRHIEDAKGGIRSSAAKAGDELRLVDIEKRLPRMHEFRTSPTHYLERIYGAVRTKFATSGLRAANPALQAKAKVLDRIEALGRFEEDLRSMIAGKSAKGSLRAIRKMMGESRYAQAREILESVSDDPVKLVDELVREDPDGGILRQLFEGKSEAVARSVPRPKVQRGRVFEGGQVGYHVTAKKNVPGIRREGLRVSDVDGENVWFFLDRSEAEAAAAKYWGDEAGNHIFETDLTGLGVRPDPDTVGRGAEFAKGYNSAVVVSGPVSADRVRALEPPATVMTKARPAGTLGVAATLAEELRGVIGDEPYRLLFSEARSTRQIVRRLRDLLEDPAKVQRRALDGLDAPDVELLDDAFARAGLPQPVYFPYEDAPRVGMNDFFPSKRPAGANILARDPHEKRFLGTLLKEGSYETDPMKAFTRRAARRARETNTYEAMKHRIERTGRVVTDKEAIPEGWVPISPDALFMNHRIYLAFQDFVEDLRLNGDDVDTAVAKALDKFGNQAIDDIDSMLESRKPQIYAVPKAVADEMTAAARWAQVANPTLVKTIYDPMMNGWRGIVLTGSPRWILNNVLGNSAFAIMQGVKVADVMRLLGERFRRALARWGEMHGGVIGAGTASIFGSTEFRKNSLVRQVLDNIGDPGSGFYDSMQETYIANLGKAGTDTPSGRWVQGMREAPGRVRRGAQRWSRAMRTINSEFESAFREASALTAAEKIAGISAVKRTWGSFMRADQRMARLAKEGFDSQASWNGIMKEVNKFYGDYTSLGPFERHVIRRYIFPFYGFHKHVVKLMFQFPFENPLRAEILRGITLMQQEMLEEYGPMPEWLAKSGLPIGPAGDTVPFLMAAGSNPFTGVTEDPVSALSPILKLILEQSTNRNAFTGEPFTDEDIVTPYGSDQSFAIDPETGAPIPVGDPAPSIVQHMLGMLPQYELIKDAIAGGATYDTASLLDVLRGKGVILDPETGEPKFPISIGQQLQKFAGAPTMQYDLAAYQERLSEEQLAALREFLNRQEAMAVS